MSPKTKPSRGRDARSDSADPSRWTLKDGTKVVIRPICPDDEHPFVDLHRALSDRTAYYRFSHLVELPERASQERLSRTCSVDHVTETALVAERTDPATGGREILGVAQLSKLHCPEETEFVLLVRDGYQGQGLGTERLHRMIRLGRDRKLTRMITHMASENRERRRVCAKVGATSMFPAGSMVRAEIDLTRQHPTVPPAGEAWSDQPHHAAAAPP